MITLGNSKIDKIFVGGGKIGKGYFGNSEFYSGKVINKCTVSGLGSENPSDVTFTEEGTINYTFEEVTIGSDIFIKIPKFYRKVNTVVDGQITSFTLADGKENSDYEVYPVFVHNGVELDYVLVGKYPNSSASDIVSVQATSFTTGNSKSFYDRLANKGSNYFVYDWKYGILIRDLLMCSEKNVGISKTSALGLEGIKTNMGVFGILIHPTTHLVYYCNDESDYKHDTSHLSQIPDNYIDTGLVMPDVKNNSTVKKVSYYENNKFVSAFTDYIERNDSKYYKGTCYIDFSSSTGGNVSLPRQSFTANNYEYNIFGCSIVGYGYGFYTRLCWKPIS